MNALSTCGIVLLSLISMSASAGPASGQLPEPGVLGLLAIGGVAGLVVAIRNRRKK